MPEHREGTPTAYIALESFLWRNFSSAREWAAWTKHRGLLQSGQVGESAFGQAMALQSALRSLEAENNGAPADPTALVILNRFMKSFGIQPKITSTGTIELTSKVISKNLSPTCKLFILSIEAMMSGRWHRFKLCQEPTCRGSYYDASKSGTKTWCSMAGCGSRNKMRRMRARQSLPINS